MSEELEQVEKWYQATLYIKSQILFFLDKDKKRAKILQYIVCEWEEVEEGMRLYVVVFPDQEKYFTYIVENFAISFG
jgi:hypothetical protein